VCLLSFKDIEEIAMGRRKSCNSISYACYKNKKINKKLIAIKRSWDAVEKFICGDWNRKGGC